MRLGLEVSIHIQQAVSESTAISSTGWCNPNPTFPPPSPLLLLLLLLLGNSLRPEEIANNIQQSDLYGRTRSECARSVSRLSELFFILLVVVLNPCSHFSRYGGDARQVKRTRVGILVPWGRTPPPFETDPTVTSLNE